MIGIPKFKYDDVEINYIKKGKGEPLVLVMGLGRKLSGWQFQVPFFQRKMMVIALDNRGVGKSSRPDYPYTMDMMVEDIKQLLDHLNITEKIHLCGISLGGMIVQNFVLKYPDLVKTLILCATTAYIDPTPLIEQAKLAEQLGLDPEQRAMAMLPMLFSRPFRKRLKEDKILMDALIQDFKTDPTEVQDYVNQGAAVSDHDTRELLHTIKQPTLIMVGTKDRLLSIPNSKFIHEKIPNSQLKIFDGPGHGFILEIADEVNEVLWNFIKEHIG